MRWCSAHYLLWLLSGCYLGYSIDLNIKRVMSTMIERLQHLVNEIFFQLFSIVARTLSKTIMFFISLKYLIIQKALDRF